LIGNNIHRSIIQQHIFGGRKKKLLVMYRNVIFRQHSRHSMEANFTSQKRSVCPCFLRIWGNCALEGGKTSLFRQVRKHPQSSPIINLFARLIVRFSTGSDVNKPILNCASQLQSSMILRAIMKPTTLGIAGGTGAGKVRMSDKPKPIE
jgi:hypothetical protein